MRVEETRLIVLPCGTRLAARIWWPDGAGPWPAVLEYLPYRRRDGTWARDGATYPAFAAAGIVGVRVDARGHGDSDGLFDDEYSPQELADAEAVIAWIAAQDWSTGAVGMMGISWGGFNALQVAMRRPPALRAIITLSSTADRFGDDIHYKGGAMLGANLSWAGTMLSYASRPPDPDVVGPDWRAMWHARLSATPFLAETWMRHPRRDAYWRHGSVCDDWGAITVPVWAIAGWGDGYRNAPGTLVAGLSAPTWGTVGPWIHKYPHFAWPRPRLDFTGMAIAWWQRWLTGAATGVEAWPRLTTWIAEGLRPGGTRSDEQGFWIARQPPRPLALDLGSDGQLGGPPGPVRIISPQHCGTLAGEYFALAPDGDLPGDQRADDALSACWEMPVSDPLTLAGRAVLEGWVALDVPQGTLVARLGDVHPDGTAALIARGVLNLSHRDGSDAPRAMTPGVAVPVRLVLDDCGYRVRAGHRLRLAISTAYWPLLWPGPTPVTATLDRGRLILPLSDAPAIAPPPLPRDPDPLPRAEVLTPGTALRRVAHDLQTGRVTYSLTQDGGTTVVPPHGMIVRETRDEVWTIAPDDPTSATATLSFGAERARGDWTTATRADIGLTCDATHWHLTGALTATEGGAQVFARDWAVRIPRDHQ